MSLAVNNPDGLKYAKQIYHKKLFQHFKLESHTNNSQKRKKQISYCSKNTQKWKTSLKIPTE